MPKVSVLMPVYNAERYLREAIDSILSQTFGDFELIIINDGSTDRSEEIILSYSDSRIVYLRNESNIRLIQTLNRGLCAASGKYVARMDADDISAPDRLRLQVEMLDSDQTLGFVSVLPCHLSPDGSIRRSLRYLPLHDEACKFVMKFEIPFCHPCIMVRSELIKAVAYKNTLDVLHIEDYDLGHRLSKMGAQFRLLDSFQFYYRLTASGVCQANRLEQIERTFQYSQRALDEEFGIKMERSLWDCISEKSVATISEFHAVRSVLDKMIKQYVSRRDVSNDGVREIRSWWRIRVFALCASGLLKGRLALKMYCMMYILCHAGFFLDADFRRSFVIWMADWSPLNFMFGKQKGRFA